MDRLFYRLLRWSYTARTWLTMRFTPLGLGVLACCAIAAVIGIDTHQSLSYQVFTFCGSLLVVAIFSSRFIRVRVSAGRSLPRFGTVGVPLRYRILLSGTKPHKGLQLIETFGSSFPSYREYQGIIRQHKDWRSRKQQWQERVSQYRRVVAPIVDVPEMDVPETEGVGEILPLRRGLLRFETLRIARPDPLGLFRSWVSVAIPQSMVILPKRYQVPPLQFPGTSRHQIGGMALAGVGDSMELRSLRNYRPGDSPRKIHWKSWAKVGQPMVREELDECSVRHTLILDTVQPEPYSERFEEAVAVAASLASSLQTQDSVLDVVFTGADESILDTSRDQMDRLLEQLAVVEPCQAASFVTTPESLHYFSQLSRCICIFLAWDTSRRALVEQLQRAGAPALIVVIAAEDEFPDLPTQTCFQSSLTRLHILTPGQIQQGLWALS